MLTPTNLVERPFPEVVWRQQDPSCVAVSSDVIDPTSFEESFQSYEAARSGVRRHSGREPSQSMDGMPRSLQYAVLCRVHTGLSSLHSVQIGPTEHAAIRLEVMGFYKLVFGAHDNIMFNFLTEHRP